MKKLLYFILIVLVVLFGILLYSRFIGTLGLKTNEIVIESNIPDSYDGLKIIHFSDLHYKKVITESRVKDVVKEINRTKPDIVLFSGDLFDLDYSLKNVDINFLIEELSKIETKYGCYAVLGDNDYKNLEEVKNIYIQSNFSLLENNYMVVHNEQNDKILIGGVNSLIEDDANVDNIITNLKVEDMEIATKIFLIHEPDLVSDILNKIPNVSIILGGHSINGSINIPFVKTLLLPDGAKEYYAPYYKVGETDIYISNGIGVNHVNFRLFNTPSINLYRIQKSD